MMQIRVSSNLRVETKKFQTNLRNVPNAIQDESRTIMLELLKSMKLRSRKHTTNSADSVYKNFTFTEIGANSSKDGRFIIKNSAPHAKILITGVKPHNIPNPNKYKSFDKGLGSKFSDVSKLKKWFKAKNPDARWITVGGPNSNLQFRRSKLDYYTPAVNKVFDKDRLLKKYGQRIQQLFK